MTMRLSFAVMTLLLGIPAATAQERLQAPVQLAQANVECCIKVCGARGGRISLCPQWCNDQLLQNPKKNFCGGAAKKKG